MESKKRVCSFIKSTMPLQREPYAPFAVVLKPSTCFPISGAQTCFMIPNLLYVLLLVNLKWSCSQGLVLTGEQSTSASWSSSISPQDFENQTKVTCCAPDQSELLAQLFIGWLMAPQFDLEHRNFLMMEYHKKKGGEEFLAWPPPSLQSQISGN